MEFKNIIKKEYNSEKDDIQVTDKIKTNNVQIKSDSLKFDIEVEQAGITEVYWLHIPMTKTNREILKKTLSLTGNTIEKETDSKGRFNLGTEHANEEKEVIILE